MLEVAGRMISTMTKRSRMLELILFLVLYFYDFFLFTEMKSTFHKQFDQEIVEQLKRLLLQVLILSLSINFIQMIHLGFQIFLRFQLMKLMMQLISLLKLLLHLSKVRNKKKSFSYFFSQFIDFPFIKQHRLKKSKKNSHVNVRVNIL